MPADTKANYVAVNDDDIGVMATQHLIDQGCRRIAHLRGPAISPGTGRLRGYRKALSDNKMETASEYVVRGQFGDNTGYEAMRKLLRLSPPPDGVFCYNDPVAAGAMKAILEAGLGVPQDIAVIGVGNVHYSDLLRVPLSTIDQSSLLLGETAAGLLLECMATENPAPHRTVWISPRLVVRESSRRRQNESV